MQQQFTNNWFDGAKSVWAPLLRQHKPQRILEIGSYEGASICFCIQTLCPLVPDIEVHCVDTNCLILDKLLCGRALSRWTEGPGMASDRALFAAIRQAPHGEVAEATVRYYIRPNSIFHQFIQTEAVF